MTQPKYNHKAIEAKWQKFWIDQKSFQAIEDARPKYYALSMLPYPSGAGLHVGHVTGYTGVDIIARYMRTKGYNVLHPMGWDSFGLPAEQYAIRTGTHPAVTTDKNINTYRRQLQALGLSYDWDREFATSDPKFYKWTQWIFTKLYEQDLAYEAEMLVNYCPALGTVLANEEVENGKSVEGGYPVERRPLRQWILKITAYAERLLNDLDDLDWPEYLKQIQRNWIGKSVGASIHFGDIEVYTTRPDTLSGATFLVLSPEHPLVESIVTPEQKKEVEAYQKQTSTKSDLERAELSKDKTGAFTGAFAKNPLTGESMPIWIADYVLMGYGTGAVMAVPAHDERDAEFAQKYDLPVVKVYEDEASYNLDKAIKEMLKWLQEHNCGKPEVRYKLRDWLFSRQRYWGEPIPILHLPDGTKRALTLDELPLTPPELTDYKPAGDGNSPLAKVLDWVNIEEGKREVNTMPQWAGSCWYYLRYCDPHNNAAAWDPKKEKYWMPVDLYVGGVEHAVLHLLYARFWHKVLFDLGLVSTSEPFKMLRNQGLLTAMAYKLEEGGYVPPEEVEKQGDQYIHKLSGKQLTASIEKMSKSKLNGVTPDEIISKYGADTLRLYEMFMGPFEKEKLWDPEALSGCQRFLNRFWDLVTSEKITDDESDEALKLGHRLISGASHDIENMFFNTAISKMMEFVNGMTKLNAYPKSVLAMAVQVLQPFAPHVAEECWENLGQTTPLITTPFPKVNPKYLSEDVITYILQVNGKVRGRYDLPKGQTQEQLLEHVKSQPAAERYLTGDIIKVIYVPDKLLNLVVQ
ncbi:MAG: leucine--tRNA ligase [Chlamydiia bacterium]|nr:leucine--tRNA ligase [Chlamydiia bacterium]